MGRLPLSLLITAMSLTAAPRSASSAEDRPPNVVIIYADDLGYADLGCFGAPADQTPNLDRMASRGRKFTNFHVSQPVCSASRTSLLTGCYANRLGIHGALGPTARVGISDEETTIAEVLRGRGYATGMAGKWHLGHHPRFLPTRHGFDEYLGLPYSNDMWPRNEAAKKNAYPTLPLIEGEKAIDPDVTPDDQALLTTIYTERAVRFIDKNKDRPFFFYLAHSMPHVPIFVSEKNDGKTGRGLYADVIREIDWSVGEILSALERNGLSERTLVVFTSDNGPWLNYGDHAGSAGPLREGKGTCWEGGVRVPCVMTWPGTIPAGTTSSAMMMTIDLLPSIAAMTGARLPKLPIDGKDLSKSITGAEPAANPHSSYWFYYEQGQLQAVTSGDGRWKLQLPHTYRSLSGRPGGKGGKPARYDQIVLDKPELYDLESDIGEKTDLAAAHPEIVKRLLAEAEKARAELGDSLVGRKGAGNRPVGRLPE
ncbi:MAG: sulfatase [Isosphaeraceae bacterium]|nr:sulfatase [Isosphaeraceae bacterium]